MPPKLFAILFDAIAEARGKFCGTFPEIIVRVAAEHMVYLTPGRDIFNAILTRLDNYTRAVRTREVGTVLADYPVDFIGGGWDDLAGKGRHARILGAMPFDAMREGLGSYLAAVSLNPNVDLSMHDRVFFALGAEHRAVVFDANSFSATHMPHLARYSFWSGPGCGERRRGGRGRAGRSRCRASRNRCDVRRTPSAVLDEPLGAGYPRHHDEPDGRGRRTAVARGAGAPQCLGADGEEGGSLTRTFPTGRFIE